MGEGKNKLKTAVEETIMEIGCKDKTGWECLCKDCDVERASEGCVEFRILNKMNDTVEG